MPIMLDFSTIVVSILPCNWKKGQGVQHVLFQCYWQTAFWRTSNYCYWAAGTRNRGSQLSTTRFLWGWQNHYLGSFAEGTWHGQFHVRDPEHCRTRSYCFSMWYIRRPDRYFDHSGRWWHFSCCSSGGGGGDVAQLRWRSWDPETLHNYDVRAI